MLRALGLCRQGQECVHRKRRARGAAQLKPADLPRLAGELARGPCSQRGVAAVGIGVVIERENLGAGSFANDKWTHPRVGRERGAALATSFYQRAKVATILVPRVVAVVVGDRRPGVERLDQRTVKLTSVGLSSARSTLVHAVEKVPDDLVCDEQSQ